MSLLRLGNIFSGKRQRGTMLASGLEFRTSEIEKLIAANELNTATKRVMDFVTEFAANKKRKQEAIDIRARYTALREESRRYGRTDLENQELSKLRYRILDFIDSVDVLKMRIFEINTRCERPHHIDVNVLVDGSRDQETAVLAVIGGQIGATAAKTDAERATRGDHIRTSYKFFR